MKKGEEEVSFSIKLTVFIVFMLPTWLFVSLFLYLGDLKIQDNNMLESGRFLLCILSGIGALLSFGSGILE